MEGMGYEEIFKSLPADEQKALLEKKGDFAVMAGIEQNRKQRQSSYESRDLQLLFLLLLDIMSRSGKENVWNQ